jgi:hypothetical protein
LEITPTLIILLSKTYFIKIYFYTFKLISLKLDFATSVYNLLDVNNDNQEAS